MSRRKKIIWTSVSIGLGLGSLSLIEIVFAAPPINCTPQSGTFSRSILKSYNSESPSSSSNPGSPKRCTFGPAQQIEVPAREESEGAEASGKRKKRSKKSKHEQPKREQLKEEESEQPDKPPSPSKLEEQKSKSINTITKQAAKKPESPSKGESAGNLSQLSQLPYHDLFNPIQWSLEPMIRREPCQNLAKIIEGLGNPLHPRRTQSCGKNVKQKLDRKAPDGLAKKQILPSARGSNEKAAQIK